MDTSQKQAANLSKACKNYSLILYSRHPKLSTDIRKISRNYNHVLCLSADFVNNGHLQPCLPATHQGHI
jgi:hypothetical protein